MLAKPLMVCHCNHYPNYTSTHQDTPAYILTRRRMLPPYIKEVIENFQLTEKYDDKLTQLGELSAKLRHFSS